MVALVVIDEDSVHLIKYNVHDNKKYKTYCDSFAVVLNQFLLKDFITTYNFSLKGTEVTIDDLVCRIDVLKTFKSNVELGSDSSIYYNIQISILSGTNNLLYADSLITNYKELNSTYRLDHGKLYYSFNKKYYFLETDYPYIEYSGNGIWSEMSKPIIKLGINNQ